MVVFLAAKINARYISHGANLSFILQRPFFSEMCNNIRHFTPSARDSHTCSSWKKIFFVIGGEVVNDYYLSDVHILDAGLGYFLVVFKCPFFLVLHYYTIAHVHLCQYTKVEHAWLSANMANLVEVELMVTTKYVKEDKAIKVGPNNTKGQKRINTQFLQGGMGQTNQSQLCLCYIWLHTYYMVDFNI